MPGDVLFQVVADVIEVELFGRDLWQRSSAALAELDVETIARAKGQVSIDRIAERANMTRRHLERRFLDHVTLAPLAGLASRPAEPASGDASRRARSASDAKKHMSATRLSRNFLCATMTASRRVR